MWTLFIRICSNIGVTPAMEAFLKGAQLDHLCDALASKLTVDEAFSLLEEGRPKLLARLKELGVRKPPELSAIAKAVANGKRQVLGVGLPVVVFTYSTGLSPADGRSLMKPLVDAAKEAGLPDSVVLDHCNEPPFAGKVSTFEEYSAALRDALHAVDQSYAGRPLILVAHSNGTTGAYGLARLLQRRVRLLVVLGRRPPTTPLLPDAIGVQVRS